MEHQLHIFCHIQERLLLGGQDLYLFLLLFCTSLANKQDLGGASEVELDSVMNLQEVVNAARCLTRLDESAATDLKNDKGIFDGFR